MLAAGSSRWDDELIARLGLPAHVLPPIVEACTKLGTLSRDLVSELGVDPLTVVAPGTHDTASAVAGTPLTPGWAYISSGTWSLVGVERDAPLLSSAAMQVGLTNEAGIGGRTRLLTNVMGLWLLESCRLEWAAAGRGTDLPTLLEAVERMPASAGRGLSRRPPPVRTCKHGRRPARDSAHHRSTRHRRPGAPREDHPRLAGTALRFGSGHDRASHRRTHPRDSHRRRWCSEPDPTQATADAAARSVIAGPVEATAAGNLLVQALATGTLSSLKEGRTCVAASSFLRRFEPRDTGRSTRAAARLPRFEELSLTEPPQRADDGARALNCHDSSGTYGTQTSTVTPPSPGRNTVAVVLGGTLTSSMNRPPSLRQLLSMRPYSES